MLVRESEGWQIDQIGYFELNMFKNNFNKYFSIFLAMQAAIDVVNRCKELKINALHIKLRAKGGVGTKQPGPGA